MTIDPTDLTELDALRRLAADVGAILRDMPAGGPTWTALETAWEGYLGTGAPYPTYSQPDGPDPLADVAGVPGETNPWAAQAIAAMRDTGVTDPEEARSLLAGWWHRHRLADGDIEAIVTAVCGQPYPLAETAGPGQDGDQPTTCPACHHPATRHADGTITCHDPDDGPHTMDRETLSRIEAVEQAVADLAGGVWICEGCHQQGGAS